MASPKNFFSYLNAPKASTPFMENLILFLPLLNIIYIFYFIFVHLIKDSTWEHKVDKEDTKSTEKSLHREKIRGEFSSIISAVLLNVVGVIMIKLGVPEKTYALNFGFLFAPIIGYMFDMWIGKDKGVELWKFKKFSKLYNHVFGSLATPSFFRYIITVILDLFISDPIMTVIAKATAGVRASLSSGGAYSQFISQNFTSIIQSIVAVLTFNAYTNQTRFKWAYPPDSLKDTLSSDLISLSTTIAGVIYMTYFVYNVRYDSQYKRLFVFLIAISLLVFGDMTNLMNSKEDSDTTPTFLKNETNRATVGTIIFVLFVFIGIVYPLLKIKN